MHKALFFLFVGIIGFNLALPLEAQKKRKKKKGDFQETYAKPQKDEKKKISELIKSHYKSEGLFTFYQDSTDGSLKMLIKLDQIGKEYIHFYYIENGAVEVGAFKGQFRGTRIIKVKKYFNKIELETQNTSFYFDSKNPLSRAQDANVNNSLLFSGEIKAGGDEEGGYLIDADPLFLREGLAVIDYTQFREKPKAFKLGSLSNSKTKLVKINNYEENSDLIIDYVYENKNFQRLSSESIADSRNISIKVQHSFIRVPENDYRPRYDDPRVGFFTTEVDDLTTTNLINYRDFINRWHLKKKDPSAVLSEPVSPITWWIENTTPLEFRETIKNGVLQWNKAFEKAGFKNAIVVKVQPDTADWDAGDIRYNVLRWTSSPNPPFGGYGPRFVNPRTGQILGADIMLEYIYHTYRVMYSNLYEGDPVMNHNHSFCIAGQNMQNNLLFGLSALQASGASDLEMEGLKKEAMLELVMHEVGHTLGLNHNMKASQRFSPQQLADKNFIAGKALSSSVMDYTAINVTEDRTKQGQYFSTTVGPYDLWAVEYGYHTDDSKNNLKRILTRSTAPELMFGNDADDMRRTGYGIDPRVMIGDLSNDQIGYSIARFNLSNELLGKIKNKFSLDGQSYATLRVNYNILMNQQARASKIISRFIGGVYVDRAMIGQNGANQPFTPVSAKEQRRAMGALSKYVFSPSAFSAPEELYNYLQRQRRGFDFYDGKNEDPKIHRQILDIQIGVLAQLLHQNTLQRIVDSELYGNDYDLSTFLTDLNDAIFKTDAYTHVNTRRQNLQIEYTNRLIKIILDKNKYLHNTRSMALYNLKIIKRIATSQSGNASTRAHRLYLTHLIDQALRSD